MIDEPKWVAPQNAIDEDRRKPLKDLMPLVDLVRVVGIIIGAAAIIAVAVDLLVMKDDDYRADESRVEQRDDAVRVLPTKLQSFSDEVQQLTKQTSAVLIAQKKMAAEQAAIQRRLPSPRPKP